MKVNIRYISLGLLAILCSCTEIDISAGREIALSCRVSSVTASTKADPIPYNGSLPSKDAPLNAILLLSTDDKVFDDPVNKDDNNLPCHTTIRYEDGSLTYPSSVRNGESTVYAKYPYDEILNRGENVYCVGLYQNPDQLAQDYVGPNWEFDNDYKHVSHKINGIQDIMLAPRISGSWEERFASQNYHHLLTWLKISICATNMDAAMAWGGIKSIVVTAPSVVTVPLGSHVDVDGNLIFGNDGISYGGESSEYTISSASGMIPLGITSREVGSIFCAPSSTYDLTINMQNGMTVATQISLNALKPGITVDQGYAAGKVFVANLYFTDLSVVEGVCSLIAWNEQKEDLYGSDQE